MTAIDLGGWRPFDQEELLERAPSLAEIWDELRPKLPPDRRWRAGSLDEASLAGLVHVESPAFRELSEGTGSVRTSAEFLAAGTAPKGPEAAAAAERIRRIAEELRPEGLGTLVLGANALESGGRMLLDGNHRAAALLLRRRMRPRDPRLELPAVVALSALPLRPW